MFCYGLFSNPFVLQVKILLVYSIYRVLNATRKYARQILQCEHIWLFW